MLGTRVTFLLMLTAFCALSLGHCLRAAEIPDRYWPRWRGPGDSGSVSTGIYPVEWSDTKNVKWKVKLPGIGCSTPAVWGNRILVTCGADAQNAVLAFDWTGNKLWQTDIGPENEGKHRNGSGSNPSPVTDGESAFVYFKSGHLAGVNLDGNLLWKTNLQERFGTVKLYWDLGTSPVLTAKHVVVAVMHGGESFVAAFNKTDGELVWKVARNYETPVEGDHSYATPIVIQHAGREAVLIWGAERLTLHDAADGNLIFTCAGFNPEQKRNWVAVASPVISGDIAVVPYGRGSRLTGIQLGGTGDITKSHRLWTTNDNGSFVPTPAAANGRIVIVGDKGEVHGIDAKTGKPVFDGRLPKHRAKYYASPVVAGKHLYATREDGSILVASIEGEFSFLGENIMHERIIASPVPVANRLLIRGEKHLFCIGE